MLVYVLYLFASFTYFLPFLKPYLSNHIHIFRQPNSERQLLEKGKKPPNRKDFTWSEDDPAAFSARYGVRCVRGAEIFEVRDEDNVILNDLSK